MLPRNWCHNFFFSFGSVNNSDKKGTNYVHYVQRKKRSTMNTRVFEQRNKILKWLFKQCNKIHFKTIVSNRAYVASTIISFFANTEIRSHNNDSYISQRYTRCMRTAVWQFIQLEKQNRSHKHKEFVCCRCCALAAWRQPLACLCSDYTHFLFTIRCVRIYIIVYGIKRDV